MVAANTGIVALVGSGEFLPPIVAFDRHLIERLGASPRVVVVPTAAAPDGDVVFQRWADMGVAHFTGLGAHVVPAMIANRADADDPRLADTLASANFIYLSGGKPRFLLETLAGTACWRAIAGVFAAGGVIAGCSAGAMVLGGEVIDFPRIWRTIPGLALAPEVTVIPHFDEFAARLVGLDRLFHPDRVIAGIDGSTALVRAGAVWTVLGRGGVTIITPDGDTRYTAGASVPIGRSASA